MLFKTDLSMCSACCGNLLILLLDGLVCCLACCFVLLAFPRPLVFVCSLHLSPGVRWVHSCLWWLGCLERGFVRASGGWLRVVLGSFCFSPCWFWGGWGSAALFWAAACLLWSAAGAVYCSPALMRCLLGGSSWMMRLWFTSIFCDEAIAALVGEFHAVDLIYSALAPESCFQPPLDASKYKYICN